jgi:hypothetical protein
MLRSELPMPGMKDIAEDPRKALKALENELGSKDGSLLNEMRLLMGDGGGWENHLPYIVAESYYEDEKARNAYQSHVDSCEYCKTLLQTIHPSDAKITSFAKEATAQVGDPWRRFVPAYSVPLAAVASVALTVGAVLGLQLYNVIPFPGADTQFAVNDVRRQVSRLAELEASNNPTSRYRAAQAYFAIEQPQQAYRQIGEGLQLAGLNAIEARKITTAADLPRDGSAETLVQAAAHVANLKTDAADREPTRLLELAMAQAKLGFHKQSLESINKYLELKNLDPKLRAEFERSMAKRSGIASAAK